jgi:hypothetical protein
MQPSLARSEIVARAALVALCCAILFAPLPVYAQSDTLSARPGGTLSIRPSGRVEDDVSSRTVPQQPTFTPGAAEGTLGIVATASGLQSGLQVGRRSYDVSGRVSLHLEASPGDLAGGEVRVKGFNVVYFDAPQSPLTGRRMPGDDKGVLGFALDLDEGPQQLKYEARRGVLSGELSGLVDLAQLAETSGYQDDENGDLEVVPRQRAALQVEIALDGPFSPNVSEWEVARHSGTMHFRVDAFRGEGARAYEIDSGEIALRFEYSILELFEVGQKLCVQPVRIVWIEEIALDDGSGFVWHYSGDGLPFGLPGMETEWAKADVVFEVREWKTLFSPQHAVTTAEERETLLPMVQDADCIEVYFVDAFSPQDLYGGGVTRGRGTASSTITTSDENADFGIDLTHLAHEVGHVINLTHPGDSATEDGSSGTLLCPSGFAFDNPAVNSQENADRVSNPLFEFTLKLWSPGPDCEDSFDCGACPDIP